MGLFAFVSVNAVAARRSTRRELRAALLIIDMHSHYVPNAYLDFVRNEGASINRALIQVSPNETLIKDHVRTFPLERGFYDEVLKLSDMAKQGVDCQVVSVPPFMFHYDQPAQAGIRMSRMFNDEAIALSKRHPGKFVAMATLPLQDPKQAVVELERVTKLGVRAVEIGASIHERELDDPELDVFWQAAASLGTLIFVHPMRPPGRERMLSYHLFNLIGFLTETTLAAARLIFSGVLDRHARLKICLAHTGGTLLWIVGRFDHAHDTIEACRKNITRKPSEYLANFYYDSLTYHPDALAYAARLVGSDRIMLGTDYPFAIADPTPVKSINAAPGLSATERAAMCGGTAASLFGIAPG